MHGFHKYVLNVFLKACIYLNMYLFIKVLASHRWVHAASTIQRVKNPGLLSLISGQRRVYRIWRGGGGEVGGGKPSITHAHHEHNMSIIHAHSVCTIAIHGACLCALKQYINLGCERGQAILPWTPGEVYRV